MENISHLGRNISHLTHPLDYLLLQLGLSEWSHVFVVHTFTVALVVVRRCLSGVLGARHSEKVVTMKVTMKVTMEIGGHSER